MGQGTGKEESNDDVLAAKRLIAVHVWHKQLTSEDRQAVIDQIRPLEVHTWYTKSLNWIIENWIDWSFSPAGNVVGKLRQSEA